MSDAARLCRQAYLGKPSGTPYNKYAISNTASNQILGKIPDAIIESAYSALISYSEALSGITNKSFSWSIVRLYYSCFYSMRCLLLMNRIIPFQDGRDEFLFDGNSLKFFKGGSSSHQWNWNSLRAIHPSKEPWYLSQDSQSAYDALKKHRDNVNYTHGFTEPELHACLLTAGSGIAKAVQGYKEDEEFLYTYLSDHLAVAYPTKLVFTVDDNISAYYSFFSDEKINHLKSTWKFRYRCPLT